MEQLKKAKLFHGTIDETNSLVKKLVDEGNLPSDCKVKIAEVYKGLLETATGVENKKFKGPVNIGGGNWQFITRKHRENLLIT